MLTETSKKVTITATSVAEIEEKKIVLENYTATVDSENPENMSMNRFFPNAESKELYKDHRAVRQGCEVKSDRNQRGRRKPR